VNKLRPQQGQSDQAKILKEFGVDVEVNMLRLDKTRVLAPPQLLYGPGPQSGVRKTVFFTANNYGVECQSLANLYLLIVAGSICLDRPRRWTVGYMEPQF